MTSGLDALDRRLNDAFPGRVVRKDLVRRVKVGANVPVYVLEYLLGKYCASDDPDAVEIGLQTVNEVLSVNFIWPDEAETAKANLKRLGKHRIIDKVKVRLVASEDKYWAELANFGDRYIHVPEELVYKHERLLQGGIWAQIDLVYNSLDDDPAGRKRPFYIETLRPIQVAAFGLEEYREARSQLSRDEWLDAVVRSTGMEPSFFDHRTKLQLLIRLVPLAERNFNLIELGPRGTGKSFVYRETSPNAILISGGKTTVPQLFVHLGTNRLGLVAMWDTVAFDEVAGIQFGDSTVVQMLKDYMESGSFARGKEELPAEASLVYLGNTNLPPTQMLQESHLFEGLPKAMIDPAFLDRLHYYLPGWDVPKMEQRFFTEHYGLVSDYLSEALRDLRRYSYGDAISKEFDLGPHLNARDDKAVKKTVSGLLKILHPHEEWTRAELREYLELALEGRRRVKEQLKKLAPHEYAKTSFSYVEKDTARELWVDVPEQPEDVHEEVREELAGPDDEGPDREELQTRSAAELAKMPESSVLEFKASARWDIREKRVNKTLEQVIVKSVAGFLNNRGGTLLIGVGDDGEPVDLDKDLETVKPTGTDGYENWLTTLLEHSIGAAPTSHVEISFENVGGTDVCRVDVEASPQPVFARFKKNDDEFFFVRLNNSTRRLSTREALEYMRQHWP